MAPGARQELLIRLEEALTSDEDLNALVGFLRDDLAYDADNRSIVGSVLREEEFDAWKDLMIGAQWEVDWLIEYDIGEVRALSCKLLSEMKKT